jgi:hypothetical protein
MSQVTYKIIQKVFDAYEISVPLTHSLVENDELLTQLTSNVNFDLPKFEWSNHSENHTVNSKAALQHFQNLLQQWPSEVILLG